jgi:hypothetical protein
MARTMFAHKTIEKWRAGYSRLRLLAIGTHGWG